ncbi:hypothetical protein PILCRDRAFT_9604 [Piloderma croceum F 1598]|uniref:PARP catalytic domain-containing protein n=1 Tax=Piloderma croceum (strain F 1598) TaxID=765440 RepID=A0A0C3B2I0_PILCF|nr:hypothetical protein PILCRDRAFT_9604 [Piloderma croceum F 1598]
MSSLVKSLAHLGGQNKRKSQDHMCEICGQRPKYVEKNGFQHPFCSRKCAANVSQPIACGLRGCRATGNRTAFGGFCSDAHAKEAVHLGQVMGCTQCKIQPPTVGDLCAPCDRRARAGPRLAELDTKGVIFQSVTDQFLREWKSPQNAVSVKKIYEVIIARDVKARYDDYKKKIAEAGNGVLEPRTFHSSQCICDLGVGDAVLCAFQACGICNIVKSSFRNFAFGIAQNTGRYGAGIYSYLNPALADGFSTSCTTSPYRVMIACDAVVPTVGKKKRGPGSINDGQRVFVNNPDAIVTSYIILYTK